MPTPGKHNTRFIEIADSVKPELRTTTSKPLRVVVVEKDDSAIMGWAAKPVGGDVIAKPLHKGDSIIFDFGGHRAGFFEFDIEGVPTGIEPPDAPARLKLVYGEVLNDVAESFENYAAWISPSWLPDEIINVDYLPDHVYMPRRHAFRYVKVEVISTSLRFGVRINNPLAHAVTSAPADDPPPLSFTKGGQDLSEENKTLLRKIDSVSLLTLRNCMQTVYEDGPRRDMRLWIGDLRLQALCSYATFKDYDLAKRCLYLFAAMPMNDDGLLCACLYEKPTPHFGGNSIVDYAMLYGVTLLDYVKATGDLQTGKDLFDIAHKQFSFFFEYLSETLEYHVPAHSMEEGGGGWHFIDWEPTLQKESSEHAIMIFCLKAILELGSLLSVDVPDMAVTSDKILPVAELIKVLTTAHREHYYDEERGVFLSGAERQLSWAGNAWAVIAGVVSGEEAKKAMRSAYEDESSVKGMTPYLHHYLCEALIIADLNDLALKHILEYWGSMCHAGAETFFEAWDPKKPRTSPYGDLHSNSFCHAWSCTPALLLRQMGYE